MSTVYGSDPAANKSAHHSELARRARERADYLVGIPDDPALAPMRSAPRITSEQAAAILKCIALDGQKKKFMLSSVSGVLGVTGSEYLLADADGYRLAFFVRNGAVTNCFRCVTPSGREYNAAIDGGLPVCSHLTVAQWGLLGEMLMAFNSSDDERPIGVRKVYIVEIDHGKPNATRVGGGAWGQVGAESWGGAEFPDSLRKFPAIFYDPKEAQKAADGLAQYLGKRAAAIGKKKKPRRKA